MGSWRRSPRAWEPAETKLRGSLPLAGHTPECWPEQRWREGEAPGTDGEGDEGAAPSTVVCVAVAFLKGLCPMVLLSNSAGEAQICSLPSPLRATLTLPAVSPSFSLLTHSFSGKQHYNTSGSV